MVGRWQWREIKAVALSISAPQMGAGWAQSRPAGVKQGPRRRVIVTAKTKREALVKVKERQRELAAGGQPAEGVNRTKTVKGYCEHYLTEVATATLRPGALDATKSAVANWIIPTVGHIRLEQVTPAPVELVGRSIVLGWQSWVYCVALSAGVRGHFEACHEEWPPYRTVGAPGRLPAGWQD